MKRNQKNRKSLSMLVASILLVTGLVGCGSSGGDNSSASSSSSSNSSSSSASSSDSSSSDNSTGTITLYNGVKEIPAPTENFAALDLAHIDHLTALGLSPVAANIPTAPTEESTPAQLVSWADGFGRLYANHDLSGTTVLNNNDNPNIENLLLIEPEYIIAGDSLEEHLSQMEAVAPVYMIDSTLGFDENGYSNWQETHRIIGEITSTSEKAEQNIANYYALLEDYKSKLGGSMAGSSAMIFQLDTKGIQYAAMESHPHIYIDLEFDAPNNVPVGSRETIAVENLVDINPDYIFITIESYEDFAILEASPIWQNLEAVKNGNVFEFAHYSWNRTKGPLAANQKLIEVCEFLLHGTQTSARFDLIN